MKKLFAIAAMALGIAGCGPTQYRYAGTLQALQQHKTCLETHLNDAKAQTQLCTPLLKVALATYLVEKAQPPTFLGALGAGLQGAAAGMQAADRARLQREHEWNTIQMQQQLHNIESEINRLNFCTKWPQHCH
jgi:hypothetical protein